jgi:hypothetical protein
MKRAQTARRRIRRCRAETPNHRHSRLLRIRAERPRDGRRPAEPSESLAPPHSIASFSQVCASTGIQRKRSKRGPNVRQSAKQRRIARHRCSRSASYSGVPGAPCGFEGAQIDLQVGAATGPGPVLRIPEIERSERVEGQAFELHRQMRAAQPRLCAETHRARSTRLYP